VRNGKPWGVIIATGKTAPIYIHKYSVMHKGKVQSTTITQEMACYSSINHRQKAEITSPTTYTSSNSD
jgi:hypothetical protein